MHVVTQETFFLEDFEEMLLDDGSNNCTKIHISKGSLVINPLAITSCCVIENIKYHYACGTEETFLHNFLVILRQKT